MMLKSTVVLLALCFSFPAIVSAEQWDDRGGSAYHQMLSAQQSALQSKLSQHQIRLNSLKELHAGGHASWLELQRQQLKTQTVDIQLDLLNQFVASVQQAQRSRPDQSIFEGMHDLDGKLLFTDLQLKTASSGRNAEPSMLQKFMNKTQQNIADAHQNPTAGQMQLVTAHQALAAEFENWMQQNESPYSGVRKGASQVSGELLSASRKQCEVHKQMIEMSILRERERLAKVNELFAQNMTSSKDIGILQARIDGLLQMQQEQNQVTSYLMEQEATSLSGNNSDTERSLNQEIKFQFEMHEARFQQASASLEKGFLQEVLSRLEQAAAQTANQHNSHLDYLAVGQQNEMNNYRHKIRMMELESEFAQCRMDVLNAQGQSGNLLAVRLDNEPNQSIDFAAGLTSASLINVLTVPAKKSKALPSALFSSSFDPFPFNFKSHNELFRPVSLTKRTPVYFSRSLSPKFSTRSLIPSSSQRRTFGSTRSRTRNYSYGIPSYKSHPTYGQAYRYGAVRSDLRPHLRVGQIPWQLPGSTPSFGTSQLQNNSRFTSFGATGNALYPTYSSSRYGW